MVRGKGNKFSPRRQTRGQRRSRSRRSQSDFNGRNVRAPARPRTAQEAPWNSLVVQRIVSVADNQSFSVNTTYINDVIIAQLELPSVTTLSWRLRMVDIYDLAGRPFDARLYDYNVSTDATSGLNGQLATGLSIPARNGWSATRLEYPKAVSALASVTAIGTGSPNVWLTGSVGSPLGITSTDAGTLLLRLHLLWRPLQTTGTPVGFSEYANKHNISFAVTPTNTFKPYTPVELPLEAQKRLHAHVAHRANSPMRV